MPASGSCAATPSWITPIFVTSSQGKKSWTRNSAWRRRFRSMSSTVSFHHFDHDRTEPRMEGEGAAELEVRLMRPGRSDELNLSRGEAQSLAARYVRALRKEYGSVRSRPMAKQVIAAQRGRLPDR